ncbi:hypothetical protein MTR67_034366, partial [Solanum verrucosum]
GLNKLHCATVRLCDCATVPTTQLPKGISHSYKLGIKQTRRRWKDHSKGFPDITGNSPKSF